jgi:O-antigen ligase
MISTAPPLARRTRLAHALATPARLATLALIAVALAWLPLRWAALCATAFAAAILLLRRPWLLWLGIGATLPFAAAIKVNGPLSLLDVALAVALGLWIMDGARRYTLRLRPSGPAVAVLLFAAVLLASAIGANDLPQAASEVVKWLEFAAVLLILPQMVRGQQQMRWVAAATIAGAAAQAVLGIYQFVFRIGPDWFVILGRFMRASGTFGQPNPYAGYLGLVLPVALSLALHAFGLALRPPQRKMRQRWTPWLWAAYFAGATALLFAALLASWSRGGWLGAAVGMTVVIVTRSRRAAFLSAVAALLLLSAVLLGSLSPAQLPQPVAARLQEVPAFFGVGDPLSQPVTDENFALIERLAHWVAAQRMFAAEPLLGVGPGNYAAAYPAYRLPRWEEPLGHAHNVYLNVLAESGLLGFAAFVVLWATAIVYVLRRRAQVLSPLTRAMAIGVLGVLAHLAVHNLVDNLFVQGMYILVALWLALLDTDRADTTQTGLV